MPRKQKRSKKPQQVGGWFWERDDPIFGASNRWIGDNVIQPTDNFLKSSKLLSKITGPLGALIAGPAGGLAGGVTSALLHKQGYGKRSRPKGKAPQHGSGATVYRTRPYPTRALPKAQMERSSPFLLTHNSSFNSVKF